MIISVDSILNNNLNSLSYFLGLNLAAAPAVRLLMLCDAMMHNNQTL